MITRLSGLNDTRTGRAIVFVGFAGLLSFLVFAYGLLQEQESARQSHRQRAGALMSLKTSYQDYEATLLLHMADPSRVMVSDAQRRFDLLEERLAAAETATTDAEEREALSFMRASLDRIDPSAFQLGGAALQGEWRTVLLAMTGIQSRLMGVESAMAEREAAFDRGVGMHIVAEALMGLSAVALLLLIGRLLLVQARTMHQMKVEREVIDRKSATQLAAIEAAPDGIVILDDDGRITFMNRAFARLHYLSGPGRKESINKPWAALYEEKSAEIVNSRVLPVARDKGFWRGESGLVNTRGQDFAAELSVNALPEGGFICTALDVKDKRAREKETEELRLQYYQAQKMESLGRLAGGIAHDFNNMLAAVAGYAQFLCEDLPAGSQTQGFARRILLATDRAKGLIEQILNFSRTNDQGRSAIDVNQTVGEVVSMLRASLASSIAIELRAEADGAVIQANPTQISQALMNLCVNAQDAMDGRGYLGVRVAVTDAEQLGIAPAAQVEAYPDTDAAAPAYIDSLGHGRTVLVVGHVVAGQRYAAITVSDSGTGISRRVMEQMFEPFFTTKDVHKGTGLGLASVHGILLAHRGFLRVDSTLEKGSAFQMLFPLLENAPNMADDDASDGADDTVQGRILVVDDEDDVRATTCLALERAGYEVFDSATAADALELIRDNPLMFDAIVSDFAMPNMTGVDLARAVMDHAPAIPFLLVSGYAEADTRERILSVPNIRDVLSKPVAPAALVKRVGLLLSADVDKT